MCHFRYGQKSYVNWITKNLISAGCYLVNELIESKNSNNMTGTIRFFCPRWGMAHLPFEDFVQKVKDAAYDGVEMDLPFDEKEKSGYLDTLKQYDLLLVGY